MGIASGDFDRNGTMDLTITNFYNEPVNLFTQNDTGFFQDDARKLRLVKDSNNVLGFGTQVADFDNDGWLDLAILNGHIYDARYADIPFRMPSQIFKGGPGGFSLVDVESSEYLSRNQLGRTLALLDWNRDGRMDLVANHLDYPIALLQNQSDAGNWLQLRLIGVDSERSAVGARINLRSGEQRWSAWCVGGDGYMATNTPVIHFGIGGIQTIEEVEIQWPSGLKQNLGTLAANQRYLIIEQADPWPVH